MKQCGLALTMYADDNNGYYPYYDGVKLDGTDNSKTGLRGSGSYASQIFPTYMPAKAANCPTVPLHPDQYWRSIYIPAGMQGVSNYERVSVYKQGKYNVANYTAGTGKSGPVCGASPSERVLATDWFFVGIYSAQYFGFGSDGLTTACHEGRGSNSVFEDGHAEWINNPLGRAPVSYAGYISIKSDPYDANGPYITKHWYQSPYVAFRPR